MKKKLKSIKSKVDNLSMSFKYKAEAEKILKIKEKFLKKDTIKFQESSITDQSPRTNTS